MRHLLFICLLLACDGCIFASPLPDCDAMCAKYTEGAGYEACMTKCAKGEE